MATSSITKNFVTEGEQSDKTINWTVACVGHFARAHDMSQREAFTFLYEHGAFAFMKEFYEVEHTLSMDQVADDLLAVCQQNGGTIH